MELVYTLCNDGEIKRHQLFKNVINDKYSLNYGEFAKETLRTDEEINVEHLLRRKGILDKQFQRGMDIVKRPI